MSIAKPEFRSKLATALDAYANKCLAKHVKTTIAADIRVMNSFDEYLCQISYDGGSITENMIADWSEQLSLRYAPATVNQYNQKARQILRSAQKTDGIQSSVVDSSHPKAHPLKPLFKSELGAVLDAFADRCLVEYAEKTLSSYFPILKSFDAFLCEAGYHGTKISIDLIEGWVAGLLENFSPSTVAHYERVIGIALHFAESFGVSYQMVEPITVPDDYQPYIFTPNQLDGLCAAADNITFTPISIYPWIQAEIPMLTRIYMSCGMRTSEPLLLRMRDVDLEQGIFTLRKTKNDIERFVPFVDELRDLLVAYCRALGILGHSESYLFPGLSLEEPFPRYMYQCSFNKMVAEVGIDIHREHKWQRAVCPYCMRHTFACMAILHLQEQGIIVDNIYPYLSAYMGHKDLYSTEKYLKFTEPLMAKSLENYNVKIKTVFSGRAFNKDEVWD